MPCSVSLLSGWLLCVAGVLPSESDVLLGVRNVLAEPSARQHIYD